MDVQNQNEMQEGTLVFTHPGLSIRMPDGTEHVITEDDYVECLFQFRSEDFEFGQYYPLNQQQADGLWYFDTIGRTPSNNGLPVKFRKARAGERVKNGTLTIAKDKLHIELWAGGVQEIISGTWLELNLLYEAGKTTRLIWQRCCVEFDAGAKKWQYIDIYGHGHSLDNEQLARVAY